MRRLPSKTHSRGKLWARRLRPRYFIDVDPRKIGQTIAGAPVISADDLAVRQRSDGGFVIVAVGALSRKRVPGSSWYAARDEIREQLRLAGLEELRDFICVA